MGIIYSTFASAEPTELRSDELSDLESDKIEELKAEQREADAKSSNNVEVNGNEENETSTAVDETSSLVETTSLLETTSSEENGTTSGESDNHKQVEGGEKEKSEEDSTIEAENQKEDPEKTIQNCAEKNDTIPTAVPSGATYICEICDEIIQGEDKYLSHLQNLHKRMNGKCPKDLAHGAPLGCSRCQERVWTYEGLERHLVMSHGLVTRDLLQKAMKGEDGGKCKRCGEQFARHILHHLHTHHQVKLCSAKIVYVCKFCSFKCDDYQTLETHFTLTHPKGVKEAKEDDWIMLDP